MSESSRPEDECRDCMWGPKTITGREQKCEVFKDLRDPIIGEDGCCTAWINRRREREKIYSAVRSYEGRMGIQDEAT